MDEATNALATINIKGGNEHRGNERDRGNASQKNYGNEKALDKYKKKNFTCHFCGKKGHIARNCFKKRDEMKNRKENEKTEFIY